jgi:hypothetical protein
MRFSEFRICLGLMFGCYHTRLRLLASSVRNSSHDGQQLQEWYLDCIYLKLTRRFSLSCIPMPQHARREPRAGINA